MPVKDSLETAERAIQAIVESGYTLTVYDDFSTPENVKQLDVLRKELGIEVVHIAEHTDHPSPNYRWVLMDAQRKCIANGEDLIIIESDVIVRPETIGKLIVEGQKPRAGMVAAVTTDEQGAINFPYEYARKIKADGVCKKRFSFCCTLLTNKLLQAYDFHPVGDVYSTLTDEEHKTNIRRGIQHCLRGDVFQIVLSRRFIQKYEGDDFKLYRALRSINPSPYLFYFDFGGFRIFGSSPETHCRIEGRKAYIDPIAGTTKRTGDAEADRRGAEYLRNDPKENAEHVMLVDLARNDLSRNCHGVKVDFYKDLQYYSHVIHLVSRVCGELDADADPIKAFIDTFPAGTLSGAPKVRAMQLISEYEPHNRGAYGGCIGYIGLDGSLNQAITIRTFVSRNGELWFQAGGGIVAKSNEDYELQEVNNKLGALRRAILMAEKM